MPEAPIQVKKGYYEGGSYNTLERFISYFYQANAILKQNPRNVLEIGAGSKVLARYLESSGIAVSTCDFDPETNPDIRGDVRSIPVSDKSYDIVCAFQVLEHIPYEDFPAALRELGRIARKQVIISLPYRSTYFEWVMKFPGIRTIFKKNFLDFSMRIPLEFKGFASSGQHYWEIDRRAYTLTSVRKELMKHFHIVEEFSPVQNKFHYFFVLEAK